MDWSTVIVGALALVGTLAGSYFGNSKTIALLEYRLVSLEEKVNKHNNVVERVAILEQSNKATWKKLDNIYADVEKIKEKV